MSFDESHRLNDKDSVARNDLKTATSKLLDEYLRRTSTSRQLADEAREVFPSGVTHDSRYLAPYPIYVERAQGSRKWDVDGNEYVDYAGGHGALLLGHNHPVVTQAVKEQLSRGTHFGSSHQLEVEWGTMLQRLVPSAELVRFTNSGTESTLLALRLARAHTGKSKILRFVTNFHGWQDHVAFGVTSHHDGTPTPGVLDEVANNILLSPPGDIGEVKNRIAAQSDIAAIILEPTGASWGQVPIHESFLHELREVATEYGIVLIFDEVITGFRCSPGGAQAYYGVTPDLTTLAKILAGGFPGGALVGRRDIMEWLDHDACEEAGREKVPHQGTFNANPISATAGITALGVVENTDACQRASDYAAELREELRRVVRDEGFGWCIYGSFSGFHVFTNPDGEDISPDDLFAPQFDFRKIKNAAASFLTTKLRIGMLAHGVEIFGWPGAITSAVHNKDDLERTVEAFRKTVRILKEAGDA